MHLIMLATVQTSWRLATDARSAHVAGRVAHSEYADEPHRPSIFTSIFDPYTVTSLAVWRCLWKHRRTSGSAASSGFDSAACPQVISLDHGAACGSRSTWDLWWDHIPEKRQNQSGDLALRAEGFVDNGGFLIIHGCVLHSYFFSFIISSLFELHAAWMLELIIDLLCREIIHVPGFGRFETNCVTIGAWSKQNYYHGYNSSPCEPL